MKRGMYDSDKHMTRKTEIKVFLITECYTSHYNTIYVDDQPQLFLSCSMMQSLTWLLTATHSNAGANWLLQSDTSHSKSVFHTEWTKHKAI